MKKLHNIATLLFTFILFSSFVFPDKGFQVGNDKSEYLSSLEREVVAELNLARLQPKKYADFLADYSKHFVGKELREAGQINLLTNEGVIAVSEAIRFLMKQKPLTLLTASKGMSRAAKDMVRMQGTTTQTGHKGRDGSTFAERISRYGTWNGSCSENIDYGNNIARRIVMALIIDDGVSSRGHRKSIFEQGFKRVGVAFGSHRTYNYMCVIELAVSYTEK
jgi:uncharacterized protein YkwD